MSMRNIRKIFGENSLPPPDPESDEEYEPLYAKVSPSKFKYQGFVLSSHSESEHESAEAVPSDEPSPDPDTKKKKKKKKKQRKMKQMPKSSSKTNFEELDEIDKSVQEVNALLGAPPEPAPSVSEKPAPDPRRRLLAIQSKHLNSANELERLFGPEEEPVARRRGRQPNLNRILRRAVIVPVTEAHSFRKSGLSMSIHRRENGCIYFAFDHSKEYQRNHKAFLLVAQNINLTISIENAQDKLHVEGLLEGADMMFQFEEYSASNALIEEVIAYLQYVAHPFFNLTDPKVRLEYRISENRPFHVAVLKYLYLLTNRACHRTALELAKMLLNLDPTDPLAVLFIIDTLALRAREHQWLIDAVDYWSKERDAGFLFNMQYSYAMAHFHVATKKKSDTSKASELLREAMLRFPTVLLKLLQNASVNPSATVQACPLFSTANETTAKLLGLLMTLHSKLVWSKWREPAVFEWLTRTADQLAEQYNKDTAIQERAKELANERKNLFRGWPSEMVRHLCVIYPMSNFLVDGAVPNVITGRSADPHPPCAGLDRYNYRWPVASPQARETRRSPLYHLFTSVLPHYVVQLPQEFQRRLFEAVGTDEEEAAEMVRAQDQLAVEHAVDEQDLTDVDDDDVAAEIAADIATDIATEFTYNDDNDDDDLTDVDDDDVAAEIAADIATDIATEFTYNDDNDDDDLTDVDDDDHNDDDVVVVPDEVAAAIMAVAGRDDDAIRRMIVAAVSRRERELNDDHGEDEDDAGGNNSDRHDVARPDPPDPPGSQRNH